MVYTFVCSHLQVRRECYQYHPFTYCILTVCLLYGEMHINRNFCFAFVHVVRTYIHEWKLVATTQEKKNTNSKKKRETEPLSKWVPFRFQGINVKTLNVSCTKQWLWVVNLFAVAVVGCCCCCCLLQKYIYICTRLNIYLCDRNKGIRHAKWSHLFLMRFVASNYIIMLYMFVFMFISLA